MCEALEKRYKKERNAAEQNAVAHDIKNLMKNLQLTLEQAMDALSIPTAKRSMYAELVNKK